MDDFESKQESMMPLSLFRPKHAVAYSVGSHESCDFVNVVLRTWSTTIDSKHFAIDKL
jgi:hypothetical protein